MATAPSRWSVNPAAIVSTRALVSSTSHVAPGMITAYSRSEVGSKADTTMRLLPAMLVVALTVPAAAWPPQTPPYRDATRPVEERVKDLLGRMTPEEKFWQLFMIPGDLDTPANDYSKGIFGLQVSIGPAGTARGHAERIH